MTMKELAVEYRANAKRLKDRINQLNAEAEKTGDAGERQRLENRAKELKVMYREASQLAVFMERYYDRGYRRNGRYTI